jgi:hypothetical protein
MKIDWAYYKRKCSNDLVHAELSANLPVGNMVVLAKNSIHLSCVAQERHLQAYGPLTVPAHLSTEHVLYHPCQTEVFLVELEREPRCVARPASSAGNDASACALQFTDTAHGMCW